MILALSVKKFIEICTELQALQKLGELQKTVEQTERQKMDRDEEMRGVSRRLEEAERQNKEYDSKVKYTG